MIYEKFIPTTIISEANVGGKLRDRIHRKMNQRTTILWELKADKPEVTLPCEITLTRLGVRQLDWDNNIYALKTIRDAIADYITPGLPRGQADSNPQMSWVYLQEKSKEKGIRIKITC